MKIKIVTVDDLWPGDVLVNTITWETYRVAYVEACRPYPGSDWASIMVDTPCGVTNVYPVRRWSETVYITERGVSGELTSAHGKEDHHQVRSHALRPR